MKTITVQNMDGSMEEVELINSFDLKDINKNFVIMSKGETISDGMSKVYVSEVIEEEPGIYKLIGISDESLWDKVVLAMKEIVRGEEKSE